MNRRATVTLLTLITVGLLCFGLGVASGTTGPVGADEPTGTAFDVRDPIGTGLEASESLGRNVERRPSAAAAETDVRGFDRSVVTITVRDDGSARWEFRYERALATDDQREEFESFAERFRTEETDLYENFRTDARALVDGGSDAVDREMTADGFARDAFVRTSLDNDLGVVELTFTWHGFGTVDDGRVAVGDVFEGGLYIGPDQELVYRPADGLEFDSVDPAGTQSNPDSLAESSSVTWEGEQQFTDRRPRAVLIPDAGAAGSAAESSTAESSTAETPTATRTGTQVGDEATGTDRSGLVDVVSRWLMAAVLLVGIGGVIAWQRGLLDAPVISAWTSRSEGTGDEAQIGADDTSSAASTSSSESASPATPAAPAPEERFRSDEDRVVSLLQDNGGRMKQARIVKETSWSKSKVSVLLSEMEDEETISRLRVGRENVVSLAGNEPEAAKSPLEDE